MFTKIDSAPSIAAALSMTNHYDRLAYIQNVAGARAVNGFFDPTKANVTKKFRKVWISRSQETANV